MNDCILLPHKSNRFINSPFAILPLLSYLSINELPHAQQDEAHIHIYSQMHTIQETHSKRRWRFPTALENLYLLCIQFSYILIETDGCYRIYVISCVFFVNKTKRKKREQDNSNNNNYKKNTHKCNMQRKNTQSGITV